MRAEDYCILCGGPCREIEASKKLGEQMDRLLKEMRESDESDHH